MTRRGEISLRRSRIGDDGQAGAAGRQGASAASWRSVVGGCALLALGLALVARPAVAIEPGEGVLQIEKRLVLAQDERGTVEEFQFTVTDPGDDDAEVAAGLVPRPFSDGRRTDALRGSISIVVGAGLTGRSLQVTEMSAPDWVTTYGGDCDAAGRITVPPDGFATCEVTNTLIPDSGDSDAVLTLEVLVDGPDATTDDFAYRVEDELGEVVAGPESARNADAGFLQDGRGPTTQGVLVVALDYTPSDRGESDPSPTFDVIVDDQPDGWVTNFGGDCDAAGAVDAASRAPVCSVVHLFVGDDVQSGEGVLAIEKTLVAPPSVNGAVGDFAFDVTDPADNDADVLSGLVPEPESLGTRPDPSSGSVAAVVEVEFVGRELQVTEIAGPDWVSTYAGDCDAAGRITVPADGFATCEVTNTWIEDSGDSDAVLTLVVTVVGGVRGETTAEFVYTVENQANAVVAGPVSATGGDAGSNSDAVGGPTTSGTAVVALDYTPPGAGPTDPPPTFDVEVLEAPGGWVTNIGGDCSPEGDVDPSLRTPICTLEHLFVEDDLDAGDGVLVVEKALVAPQNVGGSLGEFVFDVTDPGDGDREVATGLVPVPSTDGRYVDPRNGSVATVIPAEVTGRELRLAERPVPEWVTTYAGDCSDSGRVTVPADGYATCVVTNTYLEGAEGSDAVLTLLVSIESGEDSATTNDFVYEVRDDLGAIVAGPLTAEGADAGGDAGRAGPGTTGSAVIPLDYTPGDRGPSDPPPTFDVDVAEQPSGWVTNFGGDCGPGGAVDPSLATPTCTVTHLFTDPEIDEPKPQAPVAVDDQLDVTSSPFEIVLDVTANDYDPDGDLDPDSVTVVADPTCVLAGECWINLPGGGVIDIGYSVVPISGELTYQVCDTTGRCDTAQFRFSLGPPPIFLYCRDADEDLFGDIGDFVESSDPAPPAGYVADCADCDDSRSDVYPGAPELPDGIDNDCDGNIDEP